MNEWASKFERTKGEKEGDEEEEKEMEEREKKTNWIKKITI